MYRVLSCLTGQHDYRLVAVAALVCVIASFTAFWLHGSALRAPAWSRRRTSLVVLTGAITATGIWTTHFVAMLAYDPGLPIGFDITLTLVSLAIAILATTLGFTVMARGGMAFALLGGAVVGLGISAMHYTGMGAVVASARTEWDTDLVAASLLLGTALASLTGLAHARLAGRARTFAPPLLMTLAICTMHFTAMGAATLVPDPTVAAPDQRFDASTLALVIASITLLIMFTGIVAGIVDRFTISHGMVGFAFSVIATLVATLAIGGYAFDKMRVGGNNYQRIAAGKELIADVMPPPAFVVEMYLEARLAADAPDSLSEHEKRLRQLRADYLARRDHWARAALIPERIRTALIYSDTAVERLWNEIETELLPALRLGDRASTWTAMYRMQTHFASHRLIIGEIVKTATAMTKDAERTAAEQGALLTKTVAGSIAVLLGVIALAFAAIRSLVVRPVLAIEDYLQTLAGGKYDKPAPFATRDDEIGVMAKAIETLRQVSIDKDRLETEAKEARRRSDAARTQREKEKAAEAVRLSMANEAVTTLNEELNAAIERLKQAQDEMVRKGKLAQLGQLTATVAHEMRNPLGAMKTAVYLIDRKTRDKGLGLEGPMQRVHNAIQRCDNIITELLDYTRRKTLSLTSQGLDGWVASVVAEERRALPRQVAVSLAPGAGEEPIQFDESRMRRVLINLISNASEAMVGKSGELSESAPDPRIVVTTRIAGGNIEIEVADNGPGIEPENMARICEPLFTTKSFGVGLGIPAVESILDQHGGGLRIESVPGQGATMTAWFPRKPGVLTVEPASAKVA